MLMTSSLNAIVPMACVTAAAIAAMVAEAFRDPGAAERGRGADIAHRAQPGRPVGAARQTLLKAAHLRDVQIGVGRVDAFHRFADPPVHRRRISTAFEVVEQHRAHQPVAKDVFLTRPVQQPGGHRLV